LGFDKKVRFFETNHESNCFPKQFISFDLFPLFPLISGREGAPFLIQIHPKVSLL
jgi:hypothetical protein